MAFLAGQKPTAAELMLATQNIARRGRRTTATATTTTTVLPALRLDDMPAEGGYSYMVRIQGHVSSSVALDGVAPHVRYTTDGSTPTAASPLLAGSYSYQRIAAAGAAQSFLWETEYVPVADETLSLLLCVVRASGTGNVSMYADANSHIEMKVYNSGPDVGDTGVDV